MVLPSRKSELTINPIQLPVYVNEAFDITWIAINITQIQIVVMNDADDIISTSTVAAHLKKYTVTISNGGRYRVKLIDTDQNRISYTPLFDVGIRQTDLVLKSPNGGETFSILKNISIEWIAAKSSSVNLYYSFNTGLSWFSIAADVQASDGLYQWQLPDISSKDYLIKIEDAQHKTIFDTSDHVFQVNARYEINISQYPELAATGGYKVFVSNALGAYTLVRISETAFKAYSHICTHNGCTITLESKAYRCPCHGSEFDFEGNVTNGPAMRPLDLFTAVFDVAENVVVITK